MAYRSLTFDDFKAKLHAGRYRRMKLAKIAITAAHWSASTKADAVRAAEEHFGNQGGVPVEAGTPSPPSSVESAALVFVEGLEAIVRFPELAERGRKALQALQAPGGAKTSRPKSPEPFRVIPLQKPTPAATSESKLDLSNLFDNPVEGEEDDEDEDESPGVRGVPIAHPPVEAPRGWTPRPDIENGLRELEAAPIPEKDKRAARDIAKIMLDDRPTKKKGA